MNSPVQVFAYLETSGTWIPALEESGKPDHGSKVILRPTADRVPQA
jgi:hypothetical protein